MMLATLLASNKGIIHQTIVILSFTPPHVISNLHDGEILPFLLDPFDIHRLDQNKMEVNVNWNCLVFNILQKIFFCNKENNTHHFEEFR